MIVAGQRAPFRMLPGEVRDGYETAVYVLAEIERGGPGAVKIGITNCLPARLSALRSGNPRELRLFAAWATVRRAGSPSGRSVAGAIERQAHRSLGVYHIGGEWFDCGVGAAVRAVEEAALVVCGGEL